MLVNLFIPKNGFIYARFHVLMSFELVRSSVIVTLAIFVTLEVIIARFQIPEFLVEYLARQRISHLSAWLTKLTTMVLLLGVALSAPIM